MLSRDGRDASEGLFSTMEHLQEAQEAILAMVSTSRESVASRATFEASVLGKLNEGHHFMSWAQLRDHILQDLTALQSHASSLAAALRGIPDPQLPVEVKLEAMIVPRSEVSDHDECDEDAEDGAFSEASVYSRRASGFSVSRPSFTRTTSAGTEASFTSFSGSELSSEDSIISRMSSYSKMGRPASLEPGFTSIVREGWLQKIPRSSTLERGGVAQRRWQTRYFQLTPFALEWFLPKSKLRHFSLHKLNSRAPGEKGSAVFSMDKRAELQLSSDFQVHRVESMPSTFTLASESGAVKLTLRAETPEACDQWLAAFEQALDVRRAQRRKSLRLHHSTIDQLSLRPLVWNAEQVSDWRNLLSHMQHPAQAADSTRVSRSLHLQGHVDKIHSCQFSLDGRLALTAAKESRLIMWDLSKPKKTATTTIQLAEGGWTLSCAISPSMRLIAAGGLQEKVLVGSWNKLQVQGKRFPLTPVGEHEGYVSSICFLGDDRLLASGSGDSNVIVWDLGSKMACYKFAQSADILSIACNPHNPRLVVAGGASLTCTVHDVRQKGTLSFFAGAETDVESVRWNPALEHFFLAGSRDGVCRVYDVRKPGDDPIVRTPLQNYGINQAAFSPDGRWIYAAMQKRDWEIFDGYTGKRVMSVPGHGDVVSCLDVSAAGSVCTGSYDNALITWKIQHPYYYQRNGSTGSAASLSLGSRSKDSRTSLGEGASIPEDRASALSSASPSNSSI